MGAAEHTEGGRFSRCRLPRDPATVAIVGAGASGTLTAVELVRVACHRGRALHVILVDDAEPGLGVAYATTDEQHRLNVPAARMSALADDPGHFLRWAAADGLDVRPDDFVPRMEYGRYLQELLADAQDRATGDVELTVVHATATGLLDRCVVLDGARTVPVDATVLALGNPPPVIPDAFASHPGLIRDPWAPGALDDLDDAGRVLLIGTGLTMVDVALTLADRAPDTELVAVSRRGLLPRAHAARPVAPLAPVVAPADDLTLDAAVDAVREAIAADPRNWRAVVDGLRPVTQELWGSFSLRDRKRFLDGPARQWEVHRHRMAPQVAARIEGLQAEGRLRIAAGRPGHLPHCDRAIACTGPDLDVRRSGNPLLQDLLDTGRGRPDPLALGLDTGPEGELVDAVGRPAPKTLVVGPLRRGALYETTAIPEIRCQAARVADLLCGDVLEPARPA